MGLEAVKLVPGPAAVCRIKQLPEITSTEDEGKKPTRKETGGLRDRSLKNWKFTYKEENGNMLLLMRDIA